MQDSGCLGAGTGYSSQSENDIAEWEREQLQIIRVSNCNRVRRTIPAESTDSVGES